MPVTCKLLQTVHPWNLQSQTNQNSSTNANVYRHSDIEELKNNNDLSKQQRFDGGSNDASSENHQQQPSGDAFILATESMNPSDNHAAEQIVTTANDPL